VTKHPNSGFVQLIMDTFDLHCSDLMLPVDFALDKVEQEIPVGLAKEHLDMFSSLCGTENVQTEPYIRIGRSYGGGMIDAMRLRKHIIQNVPDAVVSPRSQSEVEQIIQYCNQEGIPVYVYGAGSSVTRGCEAVKGGIRSGYEPAHEPGSSIQRDGSNHYGRGRDDWTPVGRCPESCT